MRFGVKLLGGGTESKDGRQNMFLPSLGGSWVEPEPLNRPRLER